MRLVKPNSLSVLHRPFEASGKRYLSVGVLSCFTFDAPTIPLPEVNLWKLVGEHLLDGCVFDEAMPKATGELVLSARAHGGERTAMSVCAQLDGIDKTVYVVGDRYWTGQQPSAPRPIGAMPLTWTRAFGGEGYGLNPQGKGAVVIDVEGHPLQPLPNLESPEGAVSSPNDEPAPVAFSGFDVGAPQRMQHAGTYDQRWLAQRAPGFPDDFDFRFFNVAPVDQRIDGFFSGNETFVLEGMHPQRARIEGRLPAQRARAFVTFGEQDSKDLIEVPLRLDTVHLFPDELSGVVIYRGTVEVSEDDADDVSNLMVAAEHLDRPKALNHYTDVFGRRTDKKRAAVEIVRDRDLLPERDDAPPIEAEKFHDMDELLANEGRLAANQRRNAQKQLDQARAKLRAAGIDPDEHGVPAELPAPAPPPRTEDLPDVLDEQMNALETARKDAETQRAEAMTKARKMCEEQGLDFDQLVERERAKQGGPPKLSADETLANMRQQIEMATNAGMDLPELRAQLADPKFRTKLAEAEAGARLAYRLTAHEIPAAPALPDSDAQTLGTQLRAAIDAGESVRDRDFTGADLTGASLAGADLTGVFLEGAKLVGADLTGANLTAAVLARADLSDAKLDGARLDDANLGGGTWARTRLVDCSMLRAVLSKADFSEALLDGSVFERNIVLEARFTGTSLRRVTMNELIFHGLELTDTAFTGAKLEKCVFAECALSMVVFDEASLQKVSFVSTKGSASFRNASLRESMIVHETALPGADFSGASLLRTNFRGTHLAKATFSEARFDGCDLSQCDLRESSFYRARGRGALMMRTNLRSANMRGVSLMEAVLQRAQLQGADFEGANLFRADLLRAEGDDRTSFEGALVDEVRYSPQSKLRQETP